MDPSPPSHPEAPAAAGTFVLVVGSDDWSVNRAAHQLVSAGCRVRRCADSVESPFPCNALVPGRGCPLDRDEVQVVLTTGRHARSTVCLGEMGAICGLRAGIPVVAAGLEQQGGLARYSEAVRPGDDVAGACTRAVARVQQGPA